MLPNEYSSNVNQMIRAMELKSSTLSQNQQDTSRSNTTPNIVVLDQDGYSTSTFKRKKNLDASKLHQMPNSEKKNQRLSRLKSP